MIATALQALRLLFKRLEGKFPVIFVLGCLSLPLQAADPGPAMPVVRAAMPQLLTFDAVVEPERQVTVAARLSGRVIDITVDVGSLVSKGQILARIDAREATETLTAARAHLSLAQAQFHRSARLLQQQFISPAAHDKARSERDSAQAAVAQASVGMDHAVIRAPMAGVVAQRHVEPGGMALPGQALLTVIDPQKLRVTAQIPQASLLRVRAAQQAQIEFPDSDLPTIAAQSLLILPVADPATHATEIRLGLPAGMPGVQAGQFVRAVFATAARPQLVVAPQSVVRRGEVQAVYVMDDKGRITMRQVRLGERLSATAVVVLSGLHEGEKVLNDPLRAVQTLRRPQATEVQPGKGLR